MRPLIGINSFIKADESCRDEGTAAPEFYRVSMLYVDAIARAGGVPVIVPCLADSAALEACVARLDGLVFIGGADLDPKGYGQVRHPEVVNVLSPRRENADLTLARTALGLDKAVLGICLGCQVLSVAAGGALIQHLDTTATHRGPAGNVLHSVRLVPGSRLRRLFGRDSIEVVSSHHQAVDPAAAGEGFSVAALAADGTVEAIEREGARFAVGVQWHPERMHGDEAQHRLFEAFVTAAGT